MGPYFHVARCFVIYRRFSCWVRTRVGCVSPALVFPINGFSSPPPTFFNFSATSMLRMFSHASLGSLVPHVNRGHCETNICKSASHLTPGQARGDSVECLTPVSLADTSTLLSIFFLSVSEDSLKKPPCVASFVFIFLLKKVFFLSYNPCPCEAVFLFRYFVTFALKIQWTDF